MSDNEDKKSEDPGELSGGMALVTRKAAQLPEEEWPDERIGAVYRTCAPPNTTRAQFAIFLATCHKYQLNPLTREIWLANMSGKIMVVTGRDAFVKVMNREPDFRGLISGVVYAKDEFATERNGDQVVVRHKVVGFDRGMRLGGFAVVKRENKPDIIVLRRWDDFKHLQNKDSWKNYPDDMLETRCIVSAARKAYNLAGLEESTAAEEVNDNANAPVGTSNATQAIAGTVDTADALRERLKNARGPVTLTPPAGSPGEPGKAAVPVPDAPAGQQKPDEPDFEVVDEGNSQESEEAMEQRLREEELAQLKIDDPTEWARVMERLKHATGTGPVPAREPGEEG